MCFEDLCQNTVNCILNLNNTNDELLAPREAEILGRRLGSQHHAVIVCTLNNVGVESGHQTFPELFNYEYSCQSMSRSCNLPGNRF